LEVLLVVAAIGILAAIVIVAIDPNRQLAKVRDAERESEVTALKDAMEQYAIGNNGAYSSDIEIGNFKEICDTEAVSSSNCGDYVDLSDLVSDQLASIPRDPLASDGDKETNYEVARDGNGNISVRAPQAEEKDEIIRGPKDITPSFVSTIGGTEYDNQDAVTKASEGGYVGVGTTQSFDGGNSDGQLTKYTSEGKIAWTKVYGGDSADYFFDIERTDDGGYIISGKTYSYAAGSDASSDAWLVRVANDGTLIWSKALGEEASDDFYTDEFRRVSQTDDGGYVGIGFSRTLGGADEDAYLVKVDSTGAQQWTKTFGEGSSDLIISGEQTNDGGFMLAGYTYSYGGADWDGFLIKTKSDGTQEWTRAIGDNSDDYFGDVAQIEGGEYIAGGITTSFGGSDEDGYAVKLDESGNVQWAKYVGGSSADSFQELAEPDFSQAKETYAFGGYTQSLGSSAVEAYALGLSNSGNVEWAKTVGDSSGEDAFYALSSTSHGGYIWGGYSESYGDASKDGLSVRASTGGNGLSDCSACQKHSQSSTDISPTVDEVTHSADTFSETSTDISPAVTDPSLSVNFVCAP